MVRAGGVSYSIDIIYIKKYNIHTYYRGKITLTGSGSNLLESTLSLLL